MQKILVSACFLGEDVTYDGGSNFVDHPLMQKWIKEGRLVRVCPEMAGGLPQRRPPANIIGPGGGEGVIDGAARVLTEHGDVTEQFLRGANRALELVKRHDIKIAIMKEKSPSCGSHEIFDGEGKEVIPGNGVAAALLKQHGVTVFNENELEKVATFLESLG
ncbi:MAG: DUF523 domain-containing protein [Alphaproteobacteria bacterium]|nr:DUF523 domain-containing protein [Alphaproteobacteria bacterium]